jgi:hypothetical protein
MDIEATADHLRQLGCTDEQVERHLQPLRSIAAKQRKPVAPKQVQPFTYNLTQTQIEALLAKLKERQWRWVVWGRPGDTDDWVGYAILSVVGAPALRSHIPPLISSVLMQLRNLGLITKVSNGRAGTRMAFFVHVVSKPQRLPRERLEPAESHERAALSGFPAALGTNIADMRSQPDSANVGGLLSA